MKKTLVCIVCPNSCEIVCETECTFGREELLLCTGAICQRGEAYARQEIGHPRRNVTTSVAVLGGELPLCSVRLTEPIEKEKMLAAVEVIRGITLNAPVEAGEVVIHKLLGTDADVITTRSIAKK